MADLIRCGIGPSAAHRINRPLVTPSEQRANRHRQRLLRAPDCDMNDHPVVFDQAATRLQWDPQNRWVVRTRCSSMARCLFRHPDDAEAAIIGHDVAGADRIDELGRKADADAHELALAPVQDGREARAWRKALRLRKALVDDDLLRHSGLGRAAGAEVQAVEDRLAEIGNGDELPRGRLPQVGNVEQRKLGDPSLDSRDARYLGDARSERLRRPPHRGKDVLQNGAARSRQCGSHRGARAPNRHYDRGKTTGDHQSDCRRLGPQAAKIAEQLHMCSPDPAAFRSANPRLDRDVHLDADQPYKTCRTASWYETGAEWAGW